MLLEVLHFAKVYLSLRIFDLRIPYNLVLLPLPTDDLSGGEYQASFPKKLVSKAVADILIAV